jgi:hypothetical protein
MEHTDPDQNLDTLPGFFSDADAILELLKAEINPASSQETRNLTFMDIMKSSTAMKMNNMHLLATAKRIDPKIDENTWRKNLKINVMAKQVANMMIIARGDLSEEDKQVIIEFMRVGSIAMYKKYIQDESIPCRRRRWRDACRGR